MRDRGKSMQRNYIVFKLSFEVCGNLFGLEKYDNTISTLFKMFKRSGAQYIARQERARNGDKNRFLANCHMGRLDEA